MLFTPYVYHILETRVMDGDTIEVRVDLGFKMTFTINVRLMGVNAPETKGVEKPAGLLVKQYVQNWFDTNKDILVHSIQLDKYADRIDGDFVVGDKTLTQALVAANLVTTVTPDGTVTKFTPDQLTSIVKRLSK